MRQSGGGTERARARSFRRSGGGAEDCLQRVVVPAAPLQRVDEREHKRFGRHAVRRGGLEQRGRLGDKLRDGGREGLGWVSQAGTPRGALQVQTSPSAHRSAVGHSRYGTRGDLM